MLFRCHSRQIYTTAVCYSRKTTPSTTKFPIILQLSLPPYNDDPIPFEFSSFGAIQDFLRPEGRFLVDPLSKTPIKIDQVERINPDRAYDLVGTGFVYRQKGLSRAQAVDKVFDKKAALALRELLKKEDPGVVELSRVIQDKAGMDVAEWEAIFESSDGCVIFLEAKLRMSLEHVVSQSERISKSLQALGKQSRAKLYLAANFWHDDKSCISFTRSQGYGIIRPNGRDLTVEATAAVLEKEL